MPPRQLRFRGDRFAYAGDYLKKFISLVSIFLFGLLVISSGCHSKKSGPVAPNLTGSWKMIHSVGGIPPLRGDNPDKTITIKFTNDSLFRYFKNYTLIETAYYHVFLGDSTEYYPWQISFKDISLTNFNRGFGAFGEPSSIALNGDTLTIVANTTDSYKDTYVLIQ
jgi:hypothetical protein